MDFRQLRAFLAVADTGNVTRAAELLNLVQPAVSKQLRALEEDVGAELFERERHGMVLTEAGRELAGYARRIMLDLERAHAEVSGSPEHVRGLAAVGLLPSTAGLLSSALISEVEKNYPDVRVRIATGYAATLQEWLEKGDVDAALLYGVVLPPHLQVDQIIEEDLWVVGPPSAGFSRDDPVPLRSLEGRPLALPAYFHGSRSLLEHACAASRVQLTVAVETNTLEVQKHLAVTGSCITVLASIAVAAEVERGLASAAPLVEPRITRTIVLAYPVSRPPSRHVRSVLDCLLSCMRTAVQSGKWPEARWIGPTSQG